MKKISMFLMILVPMIGFGQQSNKRIQELWQTIHQKEADYEVKSLITDVLEVKELSKQSKDYASLLKAMFYEAKINITTKEDKDYDVNEIVNQFKKESETASNTYKAITEAYIAKIYGLYFEANQYKISNRTDVEANNRTDIRFWTSADFDNAIQTHYSSALTLAQKDRSAEIGQWGDLFEQAEDKQVKFGKLSVYHALKLDYADYLSKLSWRFGNNRVEEAKKQADNLVEEVLKDLQNAKQNKLYAYVKNFQIQQFKQEEAVKLYKQLIEKYPAEEIYYIGYANYLSGKELVELAEKVRKLFPNSATAEKLDNLKKDTEKPTISFNLKNSVLDNQSNPMYISYKNTDKVYVQVFKNTDNNKNTNNRNVYNLAEYKKLAAKYEKTEQYEIALQTFDDYQTHTTVGELKPLSAGRYWIVMSTSPFDQLEEGKAELSLASVNVSPYAIVTSDKKARVYNRKSGKPLTNTSIFVSNGPVKSNAKAYWETILKTDEYGEISYDFLKENTQLYFNVKDNEVYDSTSYYPARANETENDTETTYNAFVFSDRAIYRPGQVVCFKAIMSKTKNKTEVIAANEEFEVKLNDTDYNTLSVLRLKSNEFGSVNGQFVLPSAGRLGSFEIAIHKNDKEIGNLFIFVEEYKRPKFEVKLENPKAIYRFNEEVKVEGNAMAFSGANLDQAVVKYRVERREIWTHWTWKNRIPNFSNVEYPITNGEVKTNEQGKFSFNFKAIPQAEFDKEKPRTYIYTVYVDVTDSNGEMHSANSAIVVGDKVIELTHELQGQVDVKQLTDIAVKIQTLNHVDYGAKGEFAIYELVSPYPARLLDESLNGKTDSNLLSYDEFTKLFPYVPYDNEMDNNNWKEGKEVFKTSFDTNVSTTLHFKGANQLKSGTYLVKAFVWENGEKTAFDSQFTYVNDKFEETTNKLVTLTTEQKEYKAGDIAKVKLQSAENDTQVFVTVMANGKQELKKLIQVGKKAVVLEIPVKKGHENILIQAVAVKHNMALADSKTLKLSTPNSDNLKIEIESFRDKIQPGEKEKWTLKISGNDKDKVLAEVLTNMYDASLDQFAANNFYTELGQSGKNYYNNNPEFNNYQFSSKINGKTYSYVFSNIPMLGSGSYFYNPVNLNTYGLNFGGGMLFGMRAKKAVGEVREEALKFNNSEDITTLLEGKAAGISVNSAQDDSQNISGTFGAAPKINERGEALEEVVVTTGYRTEEKRPIDFTQVSVRKNLQETAFFYPDLKTDEDGNVKVEFTMPEALTQWKFMAFAHTKELTYGKIEKLVRTQKELMVVPNAPRFLRQGDTLQLSSKIVNLSDKKLSGSVSLQLFDAFTMQPINQMFNHTAEAKNFEISKEGSASVSWSIYIPKNIDAVVYRVVAQVEDFSDGEEAVLPVLSNRMLVTETMPVSIKEGQNKLFKFDKYETQHESTLENFKLTLEMTTNPMWNAIFALPYMIEYPYDCSEQIFSKVFANAIATQLINSNPRIKRVFDDWRNKGQLTSKLEQNQELKQILIEETPWVREAETQEEQMKRLAVLFDLNNMTMQLKTAFIKLEEQQNSDGGFPWFGGDASNLYITQTIVEGFGNLKKTGVLDADWFDDLDIDVDNMIANAVNYMDEQQYATYLRESKNKKTQSVTNLNLHYLYARSFFLDELKISEKYAGMLGAYCQALESETEINNLYATALKAVVAQRLGITKTANSLVKSIMETSVSSDDMGTYWKENKAGWLWYQSPVETQVTIMEAAYETDKEKYANAIEDMKIWLLKNKQTAAWSSTKATTRAVYALLNIGKSWMDSDKGIEIKVGGYPLDLNQNAQMGSGYFKKSWSKDELKPKMGIVEVTKDTPGVSYGAMYWQYFEDLDKITEAKSDIQFNKKLYLKVNTEQGQKLREITAETPIKIGEKVTVRLEIIVNQDMDYIHIKDMRASGFEPVNVFSGYRWKGEFGYYEETRDAATNFFVTKLRKGTYVFEYDLIAYNAGIFSNGITTMQNMYAPEMSAHSQGIKVDIKP